MLLTDLVRRTFVFVGLSFSDPNLLNVFAWLRISLREGAPRHWALMIPPHADDDEDRALVLRRHELFIADLRRYGIEIVTLPDPAHQVVLIDRLEARVARRAVLVSGSYPPERQDAVAAKIRTVSRAVGRSLAERSLTLVNGFGTTVGSEVISGFLEASYVRLDTPAPRMILRPFPRDAGGEFQAHYRRDMVSQAGIVVVVGGVREDGVAQGVLDEIAIATERQRPVIPVGATGGAARQIWNQMKATGNHGYSAAAFATLGDDEASPEMLTGAITEILGNLVA